MNTLKALAPASFAVVAFAISKTKYLHFPHRKTITKEQLLRPFKSKVQGLHTVSNSIINFKSHTVLC